MGAYAQRPSQLKKRDVGKQLKGKKIPPVWSSFLITGPTAQELGPCMRGTGCESHDLRIQTMDLEDEVDKEGRSTELKGNSGWR